MAPSFHDFYVEHADEGLTSIAAIHSTSVDPVSVSDVVEWAAAYGGSHQVLADVDNAVWDQYRASAARPQYIVFDRDMTIVFKGVSDLAKDEAEDVIEDLLDE